MPGKGVMSEIKSLLAEGKTKEELIGIGYAKGSIYGASRQLAKEAARSNPSKTDAVDSGAPVSQSVASTSGETEVAELRREIERTKLVRELARLQGDAVSLEQLKTMMFLLQEWVVRNFSDMGRCIVQLQGEAPDDSAFQEFERESLAELRGNKN